MQVNGRLSQEQRVWTDAAAASLTQAVQVLKDGGLTAEAEAIAAGSLATAEAMLCSEAD
jgi:hypothetical protein